MLGAARHVLACENRKLAILLGEMTRWKAYLPLL